VTRRRLKGDRGSVTVELAILTPALLLLLGLVALAGRVVNARTDVLGAARDGARAASLESTEPSARTAAQAAALASLETDGYSCNPVNVTVPVWDAPAVNPVQPGLVTVRVTCNVALSALGAPFPGSQTITFEAREVIDAYRSR
jgi:Flp pilus assembly protein TadG